jgi:hypothetical protein
MNEQQIKKIFAAHKTEVPDDGFTERLKPFLPERRSFLPQVVMGVCALLAMALTFFVLSRPPVLEQLGLLADSIARMEVPAPASVMVYIGALMFIGTMGYSVVLAMDD